MAAKDMGTKYTCFKCGTRFYDLKRPEPLCPKCGADQREAASIKPPEKTERRRAARAPVEEVEEVEQELVEEEEMAADEDFGEEPDEDY
ncbi:MAG TPA: TIGR02300 family protein [Myxococcales bacterium]|jgi:uncharacterized protein (TIGR02300 family)|nr:TIGR02300 family protein [Myxococcales bacterium]